MVIERAREIFGEHADGAADHLARARPRAAPAEPEPDGSRTDYEAESQRLVDDEGRPRPASPVLRLIERTRAEREARNDRVAGLFPPPETTEWNVREIAYDRSRRARVTP